MRTIKFRGKTIDGTWIIGDFVRPNVILEDKDTSLSLGKLYLNNSSIVIQDTVGQFTGLHDKDGKEIYEGDIIKWYEIGHSDHNVLEPPEDYIKECMDVVEFLGGTFCVEREEAPSPMPVEFLTKEWQANEDDMFKWVYNTDEYPDITVDDMYICEVIGNIHDHPSMIEKGGNHE